MPEHLIVDHATADEPIHEVLVTRAAELDDDIVDGGGETRIANQQKTKPVPLDVAVRPLAEAH